MRQNAGRRNEDWLAGRPCPRGFGDDSVSHSVGDVARSHRAGRDPGKDVLVARLGILAEDGHDPVPAEGQVLLRILHLSLDPYMRGRMSAAKSYAAATEIGQPMEGGTVGEVLESRDPAFKPGDIVRAGQVLARIEPVNK